MEKSQGLNADEIRQMVNKTSELQGQAEQVLEQAISGKIPVFDPRSSDAVEENDGAAVIWTTKSIELAYKAIKDGYSLRKSPFYRGNTSLRKPNLNFQYTEEELQEIIRCKQDIIYFANKYCYLKTETGVRSIKLRPYQEKLLRHYQDNRFSIVCQSRQSGKTTTTAIFIVWFTCFHVDKTFGIIANKDLIAQEVFRKIKTIVEDLPFFLKPGCYSFGPVSYSFDNGCKCLYRTATIDSMQGFTLDGMLWDEAAYVKEKKAREFWVNIYPTISSISKSKIIIASTPNGKNLYFELWQGAINGTNKFKPFRVDWWQVPGHDDQWAAQERANIGEEGFAQQYGLSFDAKMKSLLTAGTFHFLQKIEQKFTAGLLPIGTDWDQCFRWSTQFRYNLAKDWFLLSIDIAEGLGQDCSTIKIKKLIRTTYLKDDDQLPLAHFKMATVGVFESDQIEINDFAKVIVKLCRRMNLEHTRIVVERNTYGDLLFVNIDNVCDTSTDGFEIPSEVFAKFKRKEDGKMEKGLRTNTKIKRVGVSAYQSYMNNRFNIETDDASIEQIREFGDDGNGNFKASVGHDDLVTPELNLAYYIKSNNVGWREFLAEFGENEKLDTYNLTLIQRIDTDAAKQMQRDAIIDNADIVDDNGDNEYSTIDNATERDDEYALASKIQENKQKRLLEEMKKKKNTGPLIQEALIGSEEALDEERGDDEYAMAFKQLPKKKEIENRHVNEWMSRDTSKLKIR